MRNIWVIYGIMALTIVGCSPKKPVVVDPCATAPTACFGKIGQSPSDQPVCVELVKCNNWRLVAR